MKSRAGHVFFPSLPSAHLLPSLPPPAAPGGFPAPSAGPVRHPCHAQGRAGPCRAGPCEAVPCRAMPCRAVASRGAVSLRVAARPQHPAGRSSGCDRLTCHACTCSCSLGVSKREQQQLENRAGGECPRRFDERVGPGKVPGKPLPLIHSYRPSPHSLCRTFLILATLVLSSFQITPKSPPSPHLHLFHSCFPAPLHPVLHIMPGFPLSELCTESSSWPRSP